MRFALSALFALVLAGCVGHEEITIDLPDGTKEFHTVTWVKHPIGPNTQTDIAYRCDRNYCSTVHSQTGSGGGVLDLVPAAALDEAVGLSNQRPPVITQSGGGASASALGGNAVAAGGNANASANASASAWSHHYNKW